jgi:nucleoid-associated protein YgaU
VRSFCAVGDGGEQARSAGEFIALVDKKLAKYNNIAVGFDATKVDSYEGLLSALEKKPTSTRGGDEAGNGAGPAKAARAADGQLPEWNPEHPERAGFYRTKEGDTLAGLCLRVSRSADAIKKANPEKISDTGEIKPGTKIKIPRL